VVGGLLAGSFGSDAQSLLARERIILNEVQAEPVGTRFALTEDPAGSLELSAFRQQQGLGQMELADRGDLYRGYTRSSFWLKLHVVNQTDRLDWYVVPKNPHVTIHEFIGPTGPITVTAGIDPRLSYYRLGLSPQTGGDFYFRVSAAYFADLRFEIVPEFMAHKRHWQEFLLVALIVGGFAALMIYNMFLLIYLKDRVYAYYILFALVNFHLNLIAIKFPADILQLGDLAWLSFVFAYRPLAPLTTFLFAREFLQARKHLPQLDRLFQYYMVGLLVLMVVSIGEPQALTIGVQDSYFLVGLLLLVVGGIRRWRQGFTPALYYLVGLCCFVGGIFVYLAAAQSLIPSNTLTLYASFMSQGFEMLLMSLALAARVKYWKVANQQNEANVEFKSRLLRLVSHDIANPLTVISGASHFLAKDANNQAYTDRLQRSVEMIHEIIRFVGWSNRLEDERQLQVEAVSVAKVFDDIQLLFQGRAEEKGVILDIELPPADLQVLSERISLTNEILSNLVSNAIKFSYAGGVVKVWAERTAEGSVKMTVSDQGIGMNQQMVKQLGDDLRAKRRAGTTGEMGFGYGLSLALAFVKAYQGQYEVQGFAREDGHEKTGATFTIYLPTPEMPRAVRRPRGESRLFKPKVLFWGSAN
jgi:signal transduction histidine kinase